MMIRENQRDLSEPKTLKVTLPTKLHLQLHQLKILQGQNISDTVEVALRSYFEEIRAEDQGPEPTPGDRAPGADV
ncbi:MAG: hypothetical protein R3185_07115 [Candidatus Thermoplasmatota archaeon]|nr:hypothetical protein [Candidatus Thermoplasmatota archaeon]